MAEGDLAWEQQHPHGKRQHQMNPGIWWWRRCATDEGEKQQAKPSPPDSCPLNTARDWEMSDNLNQRLTFPPKITVTNLHADLIF